MDTSLIIGLVVVLVVVLFLVIAGRKVKEVYAKYKADPSKYQEQQDQARNKLMYDGAPAPDPNGPQLVRTKTAVVDIPRYICGNCGAHNSYQPRIKGSFTIGLILWCCAIVPGIIYSIWRRSNQPLICTKCGANTPIPGNSPKGLEILQNSASVQR